VDKNRTVIILNANPNADALHPDAIYRLNIDNDGDYLTDVAFSCVFAKPQNGRGPNAKYQCTPPTLGDRGKAELMQAHNRVLLRCMNPQVALCHE
jgi:hypothetical protein